MITNFFERRAHHFILLWGWKRNFTAFFAGALLTLTLDPFKFWPFLFISFPIAVWLMDGMIASGGWKNKKGFISSFKIGWWFGFGYFLSSLWWIGNAFLVDADQFIWFMPLAVVLLPACLAIFYGFGFAFASLFWSTGASRILSLAAFLSFSEYLRGHLFTGFPWNALGYTFIPSDEMSQIGSVVGLWGLTWIAIVVGASLATLANPELGWRSKAMPYFSLVLIVAQFSFGIIRLNNAEINFVPGMRLRIIQPNIQQDAKFKPEAKDEILAAYETLSNSIGENGIQLKEISHVVWPESALPVLLENDPQTLNRISQMLPLGVTLLTGAVRVEEPTLPGKHREFYNSLYAINDQSEIVSIYNKKHLVPFGEYLPFQELLESWGLRQLTKLRGGFTPGRKQKAMAVPRAPLVSPLICYEAIFPGEVVNDDERPHWMINVTNDGWFGKTIGPHQHLMQAKMRSIEEGIPMVRAANTGISAVIDSYGRIIRSLPLAKEGFLDSPLPKMSTKTPYSEHRDFIYFIMFGISCLIIVFLSRKERQQ